METKGLGDFAAYCQEHSDDPTLAEEVAYAERWADISEAAYAKHIQPMDRAVEWGYRYLANEAGDKTPLSRSTLETSRDVLTRFWQHGEAFQAWFSSKVVLVTNNEKQTTPATQRSMNSSDSVNDQEERVGNASGI